MINFANLYEVVSEAKVTEPKVQLAIYLRKVKDAPAMPVHPAKHSAFITPSPALINPLLDTLYLCSPGLPLYTYGLKEVVLPIQSDDPRAFSSR